MIGLRVLPRKNTQYPNYLAPLNTASFAAVRIAPSLHQAREFMSREPVELARARSMARHPSAQGNKICRSSLLL